jgi:D-aspartate ligase
MTSSPPTTGIRSPVIVMGAHIAALGALRVLARQGIETYVIDDTQDVITRSRWYRPTQPTLAETADPQVLAAALRRIDLPEAVLLPCSDQWTQAVAGLPDDLRDRFRASLSSAETIASFVDKERFADLTEHLDVPRPRTIRITSSADLDRIADAGSSAEAWFLKPTESQRHNRRFGTKGAFVTSLAEAAEHVRSASEAGISFLLQEWIPGDPAATVLIDGFVDRHGHIAALVARRRVRMHPPRLANTCCGVTIPIAEVADAVETMRTVVKAVSFRGMFNAEFKFDARDGRHKIIEVNPRPFWFIAQIADVGIDLATMAYLDAQELPVPTVRSYRLGRHSTYELVDAKAIGNAWRHGRGADGSIARSWLSGDRALFWWSDPRPALRGLQLALERRGIDRAARGAGLQPPQGSIEPGPVGR